MTSKERPEAGRWGKGQKQKGWNGVLFGLSKCRLHFFALGTRYSVILHHPLFPTLTTHRHRILHESGFSLHQCHLWKFNTCHLGSHADIKCSLRLLHTPSSVCGGAKRRRAHFPGHWKRMAQLKKKSNTMEDTLWDLSQQIREDRMGARGWSEWEDLLLSYSARKMAFFTFLKVWFEFGVLQMRKDGTGSIADLPEATQRVKGKAEERIHCSSVGGQRCPWSNPKLPAHSVWDVSSPLHSQSPRFIRPQVLHLNSPIFPLQYKVQVLTTLSSTSWRTYDSYPKEGCILINFFLLLIYLDSLLVCMDKKRSHWH